MPEPSHPPLYAAEPSFSKLQRGTGSHSAAGELVPPAAMTRVDRHGVFGTPPSDVVAVATEAEQFSPLVPHASALEDVAPGTLSSMTMYAAASTLERRHDLALMLRALAPGAAFIVLAPKDMGGSRLRAELEAFGCSVSESAKRHHRICTGARPVQPNGLDEAIGFGAPRLLDDLGLWSQPGVFSWNRVDPGTALLLAALPTMSGRGADLGCGVGWLAHAILGSAAVTRLDLVDIDRRAVAVARRNVADPRADFVWADARVGLPLTGLDFVVMNPPFHERGREDRTLGQTFIERAASALRPGGHLWMVANKHMPYEHTLKAMFRRATPIHEAHGFKVVSALK